MSEDAPHTHEVEPVDTQRLLLWYYDAAGPGRPHIRRGAWNAAPPASIESAGL